MRIIIPLYIEIERKTMPPKKYYLNLNSYRNRHYQVNNNIKKGFCSLLKGQLEGLKFKGSIIIEYQLYYPDKRKRDKGNILSVIQKFFLDSLVSRGCLLDDNDDWIDSEIFHKPIYDKGNGRCEVFIRYI